MADANAGQTLRVEVIYSPAARKVFQWALNLPPGASVRDALEASVFKSFPDLQATDVSVGVWAKKAGLQQRLRKKDRVEIYRPLRVDPKVARRERFKHQGVKAAGLFARSRPGAKAGY